MAVVRQPSGELFPTDSPIPASQMIGREDDVQEIAAALIGATNLIVAGPRRIGKTSVCQAAVTRAKGRGHYTASLDLFRIADTAELA
jgi:AAA+ ATPase superfamily predicted ATPase